MNTNVSVADTVGKLIEAAIVGIVCMCLLPIIPFIIIYATVATLYAVIKAIALAIKTAIKGNTLL